MRIKGIDRTSTIAWSPGQQLPFLAMGTVAGALDASFSTKTELELFDLNLEGHGRQLRSLGSISVATR